MLKQAQLYCVGSPRDELVVDAVTLIFMSGLQPMLQESTRRKPLGNSQTAHIRQLLERLRHSGRQWRGEVLEGDRVSSCELVIPDTLQAGGRRSMFAARAARSNSFVPQSLPSELAAKVQATIKRGAVQAIPRNADHMHLISGGSAGSVLNAKAVDWAKSEAGQAWASSREALFKSDCLGNYDADSS